MKRYYLAYGSNLNLGQMRMRCPEAKVIGTGEIDGYELLFKGSHTGAYLTIEKCKGATVPAAVWEVTSADERELDYYEGFPRFYYKAEMVLPVKCIESGKTENLNCFVYIMHEERLPGVPTIFYLESCIEGYHTFGFDLKFLAKAVKRSREGIHYEKAQT